jgi:acyl-CoA dehydrogenase
MSETSELLQQTAERIFGDHCDLGVLRAADAGNWPKALWDAVAEAGLTAALVPEERGGAGLSVAEAMAVLRPAARFAAPIPLAESMLAGWLLAGAGLAVPQGVLTVAPVRRIDALRLERRAGGWRLSGQAQRIPWGRTAQAVAVLAEGPDGIMVVCLDPRSAAIAHDQNLANEPRDTLTIDATIAADAAAPAPIGRDGLHAFGATLRANQIAGALAQVLDLAVRYAQERVQFGRPIGKFQAVQQQLAMLAGQAAAATAAADMAAEAAGRDFNPLAIGAAKLRAGEAASVGCAIAHQVHGAMGFTREHQLHFNTRRLWSWRDEFGNEAEWGRIVGGLAARAGSAGLWAAMTAA